MTRFQSVIHNLRQQVNAIKKNYRPERVEEGLKDLDFTEEGLVWCEEREKVISLAVAAIGMQWKLVKHDNSGAKNWGQGILSLLILSNEALHGAQEMPGQQLNTWHAVNAGIYNYSIFFN